MCVCVCVCVCVCEREGGVGVGGSEGVYSNIIYSLYLIFTIKLLANLFYAVMS